MNVLSVFDGISCGQLALQRAGMKVNKYYASEIDEPAIKVTQHNFPSTIQLGDVTKITAKELDLIDLFIGGSPCQSLSGLVNITDKAVGFEGKSKLFFEYVRILKELQEINPNVKFLLENVASMKKSDCDIISEILGVQPVMIDSALLSAQTRKRYYWTNIADIQQPLDLDISLQSILESGYTEKKKAYCITATYGNACVQNYFIKSERQHKFLIPVVKIGNVFNVEGGTSIEIIPSKGTSGNRENLNELKKVTSKLTPVECERLQTLPDNYTSIIKNYDRYKTIGNGWNVETIVHIFKHLKKSNF